MLLKKKKKTKRGATRRNQAAYSWGTLNFPLPGPDWHNAPAGKSCGAACPTAPSTNPGAQTPKPSVTLPLNRDWLFRDAPELEVRDVEVLLGGKYLAALSWRVGTPYKVLSLKIH